MQVRLFGGVGTQILYNMYYLRSEKNSCLCFSENHQSFLNGEVAKSMTIDRSVSSASNGSATSGDEDCDDSKTGKSQSRIDKWKAKHEAMLKLAQKTDKTSKSGKEGIKEMSVEEKNADILALDPSAGVVIDFDRKEVVGSKPHTRHNATAIQQALSV